MKRVLPHKESEKIDPLPSGSKGANFAPAQQSSTPEVKHESLSTATRSQAIHTFSNDHLRGRAWLSNTVIDPGAIPTEREIEALIILTSLSIASLIAFLHGFRAVRKHVISLVNVPDGAEVHGSFRLREAVAMLVVPYVVIAGAAGPLETTGGRF